MPIHGWVDILHRQLDKKGLDISHRRVPVDPNAYHLIVGLGGTGCRALIETKGYLRKYCKDPESHVAYLAIDTDLRELRDLKSSGITGEVRLEDHETYFPAPPAAVPIAKLLAPQPELSEWVDERLSVPPGGSGADHRRQAGRLLLWNDLARMRYVIHSTICRLCRGVGTPFVFTVYLLTGVSGGTGSGTFLDMAYFLRETMRDIGGFVADGRIYGYFYMPDINDSYNNGATHFQNAGNAYAALQELDYNLSLFRSGEHFLIHYEHGKLLKTGIDPHGMFDHVHLVSATNSSGVLTKHPTQQANAAVAQNILSFVTNAEPMIPVGHGEWKGGFYGNVPKDAAGEAPNDSIAHRYDGYLAIGSSRFELPVDDMMMYIAKRLFDELKVLWDYAHRPDEKAGTEIRKLLDFRYIDVATGVINRIPQLMRPENLSIAQLRNQREDDSYFWIDEAYAVVNGSPLWIPRAVEQLRTMVAAFKQSFDEQLRRVFVDPKRGPIYAQQLIEKYVLVALAQEREINRRMIDVRPMSYPTVVGDYENPKKSAMDALRSLHSHRPWFFGPKQLDADLCNETGAEFFRQCVFASIAEVVDREYYTVIEEYVRHKQMELYSFVVDLLSGMTEIFDNNARGMMHRYYAARGAFNWQDLDIDRLSGQLDSMFEACLKDGTGMSKVETLLRDFLEKLWQDTQLWLQDLIRFDPRRFVSGFVDQKFGWIAEQSIESIVKALLAEEGESAIPLEVSVQHTLMPMLLNAAKPMYFGNPRIPRGTIYTQISIPQDCPIIFDAVRDYVDKHKELHARIVQSTLRDRILVQTVLTGVQLAGFASVEEAEAHYAASYLSSPGVHLYHPTMPQCRVHMDWNELYTLIPRAYRTRRVAPQTMRLLEQEDRRKAVLAELFDADNGYAPRYPFVQLVKTKNEWTIRFSMTEEAVEFDEESATLRILGGYERRELWSMKTRGSTLTELKEIDQRATRLRTQGLLSDPWLNTTWSDFAPLTVKVVKDPVTQSPDEEKTFFNLQETYLTRYMLMRAVEAEVVKYRVLECVVEKTAEDIRDREQVAQSELLLRSFTYAMLMGYIFIRTDQDNILQLWIRGDRAERSLADIGVIRPQEQYRVYPELYTAYRTAFTGEDRWAEVVVRAYSQRAKDEANAVYVSGDPQRIRSILEQLTAYDCMAQDHLDHMSFLATMTKEQETACAFYRMWHAVLEEIYKVFEWKLQV